MRRMLPFLVLAGGLFVPGVSALGRDPYYDRGPWSRDDGYGRRDGSRRSFGSPVDTVLRDLDRVYSRARFTDSHERKHFEKAREELFKFQDKWRSGRFDTGRIDKAVEHIEHLVRADQIHPRDRQTLGDDLRLLRDFRSGRGSYRNGPYGYR
jgi:hypothetical protein